MWGVSHFISGLMRAGLAITCLASLALAGDIPAPVKKPRDKTGAVDATPGPVDQAHEPVAPEPTVTKSKPAAAKDAKDRALQTGQRVDAKEAKPAKAPDQKQDQKQDQKTDTSKAPSAASDGKPAPATASSPANAAVATPPAAPPAPPKEWTAQEIEAAKAHCTDVLKGVEAVSMPEPPFRDGECGAPAAVRLISIGKNPQVSLSPPALLTCDMVAALHTWMKQDVQPLATARLGSKIIKIETMSDYSCRNAYGRVGSKLSEHGHANALDIRGFVTANAKTAYVLESWGPTKQDLIARIAAAKAAEAKALAEKSSTEAAPASTNTAAKPGSTTAAPATATQNLPALRGAQDVTPDTSLGFEPARLGGPKEKDKKPATSEAKAATTKPLKAKKNQDTNPASEANESVASEQQPAVSPSGSATTGFLKLAHASACRIFGTTLGPEANAAHRNHFHVDMAPRKSTRICD